MGEEDITLGLFAGVVDHDVDRIARLYRYFPVGSLKLFDGDKPFRLVPEIDDDFLGRDAKDSPLQNFIRGRGREMAVIVE